jgi:peptidoglycan hydrolase-like protein with peptidoglycan-binding domain
MGVHVRELQDALNTIFAARAGPGESAAASLAVDGIYGPATASRVRDFQSIYSLPVDGIVGSVTMGVIQMVLAELKKVLPTPPRLHGTYSRMKALLYLANFWDRVETDGKVAMDRFHGAYPKELSRGLSDLPPGKDHHRSLASWAMEYDLVRSTCS